MPFFRRKDKLGRPDKPRILLWTTIFGGWYSDLSPWGTAELPSGRCYISNDRRTLAVSDAVVFYACDMNGSDLPARRAPGQKWVFWTMEAPTGCHMYRLVPFKSSMNWTMTYRRDSDIVHAYAKVERKKNPTTFSSARLKMVWKGKKRLAIWPVGHCNTSSKREDFVRELRRHMPVDVIGKCGRSSCSPRSHSCYQQFEREYFFHLSFENSICKDYVTEKLYATQRYDIVPVTFGAKKKRLAPPGSYIDALKFSSPKFLADYLKKVARNFKLYRRYFTWRRKYNVVPWSSYSYHKLCSRLYSASFVEKSVYTDLVKWWKNGSNCRVWNRSTMQLSPYAYPMTAINYTGTEDPKTG